MWHIYTMEYYSAIKRNGIMPVAITWMDLEVIITLSVSHKWSKPKTNIIWYHLYVESKKKEKQMNLFPKQKEIHRHRKQTPGCQWGKMGERDKLGVWD